LLEGFFLSFCLSSASLKSQNPSKQPFFRTLKQTKTMGRPITREVKLRDGFYIEVRSKGAAKSTKIRRDSYNEIQSAVRQYKTAYDVNYLGEFKNGKAISAKKGKAVEE
jgi:hypothetical protein